ncbi:hypothetical protein [Streptomyces sp. NPDC016626]|uniref:hypothetical protein n=1 Tax=Streptomyces sp. NPDC016626 TaxID=3364968 RepID=UPI0036F9E36B
MGKWREDAQPERPSAVGAIDPLAEDDEDRGLPSTRVLPLSARSAGSGARDGAEPRGTSSGDGRRARSAPGRADAARDAAWDAERTAALRIPRPPAGTPSARGAGPVAGAVGARPPRDRFPAVGPPRDTARVAGSSPAAPGEARAEATRSRTPVRDPWQEEAGGPVAATHDPHEVTVQLDAVRIGDGGLLHRSPARAGGAHDASGGPVFVDESGRRSRLYRRIGLAVGLACAGYAVVMAATLLSGNSDAPWMPVPGQEQKPAGKVGTTRQPADTDGTPASGTTPAPAGTPTTGAPTPPAPGATAPATGATGTADQPVLTDPAPTPTGDGTAPATGDDGTTPAVPDETPGTPLPDPEVTGSPDPVTTAPTDGGDVVDTDDVAGAPAGPAVLAEDSGEQPEPSTTPAAQPPENVV